MVLDESNSIPVCRDFAESLERAVTVPDYFVFGIAPSSGMLSFLYTALEKYTAHAR